MAKINSYNFEKKAGDTLFLKEFKDSAVLNRVVSFTIQGNIGTKLYFNDSPYPIMIYNKNGIWSQNFKSEFNIEKIRIIAPESDSQKRVIYQTTIVCN